MKAYEFDAVIIKKEDMDAAYIEFPYEVQEEFGTKGQVKVIASFDGCEYRGSLAKMGHHCHILGLTQKIRAAIGKQAGDIVHVILKKDDEPRVVEVPEDLKALLDRDEEAKNFFEGLSFTNKNEYVQWIISAKKAETRSKRLEDSLNMLRDKVKQPR